MKILNEIRQFLDFTQLQYVEAFNVCDQKGMFDASYALARAYTAMGNLVLAGRWAHECEKHTDDAGKILNINMLLLCGVIKHKYLNN